jgi:hypothetical protein
MIRNRPAGRADNESAEGRSPSHGENRSSILLGSASSFNGLSEKQLHIVFASSSFLQLEIDATWNFDADAGLRVESAVCDTRPPAPSTTERRCT